MNACNENMNDSLHCMGGVESLCVIDTKHDSLNKLK